MGYKVFDAIVAERCENLGKRQEVLAARCVDAKERCCQEIHNCRNASNP